MTESGKTNIFGREWRKYQIVGSKWIL